MMEKSTEQKYNSKKWTKATVKSPNLGNRKEIKAWICTNCKWWRRKAFEYNKCISWELAIRRCVNEAIYYVAIMIFLFIVKNPTEKSFMCHGNFALKSPCWQLVEHWKSFFYISTKISKKYIVKCTNIHSHISLVVAYNIQTPSAIRSNKKRKNTPT